MNQHVRATFVALKDFDFKQKIGIAAMTFRYAKGERISLNVRGRMTRTLIQTNCIAVLVE